VSPPTEFARVPRLTSRGSRVSLGVALWLLGTLPFLTRLYTGWTSWDVGHYLACTRAFLAGQGIYTAVPFEYPPYALAWFAGPASAARDVEAFRHALGLLIWVLDAAIKAVVLWLGLDGRGRPNVWPFIAYTLTTTALGHILLQRFDVIPAALSVFALVAFARGWAATSGVIAGIAIGTKAYPALLVPVLIASTWRRDRSRAVRFVAGAALALSPLLATSFWGPWWRFASAHTGRGLEAESLWASVVWLLHYAGLPARWEIVTAWVEVTGPTVSVLLTPVRLLWMAATAAAVVLSSRLAMADHVFDTEATPLDRHRGRLGTLAALVLVPIATFVVLSPVLSPQFHLWLAPLAGLALLGRHDPMSVSGAIATRRALWCIVLSGLLVPAFFPSRTFDTGLDLGRTFVLVIRNGLLAYGVACLWRAVTRPRPRRS